MCPEEIAALPRFARLVLGASSTEGQRSKMATTTCGNCGRPLPATSSVCTTCGTQVPGPVTEMPPPPSFSGVENTPQPPAAPPPAWNQGQAAPGDGRPPSTPSGATTLLTVRNLQILVGVGIAVMFISSFLPWATVWVVTVNGMDSDGMFTAFCSVVVAVLFGIALKKAKDGQGARGWYIGSLIASVITFVLYVFEYIHVSTVTSDPDSFIEVSASPSMGLYLGPIAGVATVFGLFMLVRTSSLPAEAVPAPPG